MSDRLDHLTKKQVSDLESKWYTAETRLKTAKETRVEIYDEIEHLRKERASAVRDLKLAIEVTKLAREKKKIKYINSEKYLLRVCSTAFGCTIPQMKSKSRKREYVYARNLFVTMMKKYNSKLSLEKIGAIVDRDHSNCTHSVKSHYLDVESTVQYMNGCEIAIPLIEDYFDAKK